MDADHNIANFYVEQISLKLIGHAIEIRIDASVHVDDIHNETATYKMSCAKSQQSVKIKHLIDFSKRFTSTNFCCPSAYLNHKLPLLNPLEMELSQRTSI